MVDPDLWDALGRIKYRDNRVLRVVYSGNINPWYIVTVCFDREMRGKLFKMQYKKRISGEPPRTSAMGVPHIGAVSAGEAVAWRANSFQSSLKPRETPTQGFPLLGMFCDFEKLSYPTMAPMLNWFLMLPI